MEKLQIPGVSEYHTILDPELAEPGPQSLVQVPGLKLKDK